MASANNPGLRRIIATDWRSARGMGAVMPMPLPKVPGMSANRIALMLEARARGLSGLGCTSCSGLGAADNTPWQPVYQDANGVWVDAFGNSFAQYQALSGQGSSGTPMPGFSTTPAPSNSGGFLDTIASGFKSLFGAAPQLATTAITDYRLFTGQGMPVTAPPATGPSGTTVLLVIAGLAAVAGVAVAVSSRKPKSNPRRLRLRTYRRSR